MIDQAAIDELRRSTDIVALIGRSVKYTGRKGNDFWASCPLHRGDETASFKVNNERGRYHCFACQADGDCFAWVQATENCTFPEAVERLSNGHAAPLAAPQQSEEVKKKRSALPLPIFPVPADAPAADFVHRDMAGLPSATWAYRNAAGELLGYTARFDKPDGGKDICPRVYTPKGWRWTGFPKPRPLYGLDLLAARPDAPVVVFEGEKKAQVALTLLPGYVGVSWLGGTGAVAHVDWEPLKGRECVLWPDADDVGRNAMKQIAKLIGSGRVLAVPADWPKGHDIVDLAADGWTPERTLDFIKERASADINGKIADNPQKSPIKQAKAPIEAKGTMPDALGIPAEDPAGAEQVYDAPEPNAWPFTTLGHRNGVYAYLPRSGGTVITLTGGGHTKGNLMMLAPLNFWEMNFGCRDNKGYDSASNALIQAQHRRGIFDPTALRGRGAWWDEGRVIIHLGDRLLVNGDPLPIHEMQTDYTYEVGPKIRHANVRPLTNAQSSKFIELCKMMSWERSLSGYLLAGWCVLAPICGALKWRPHISISGAASAGKSYIVSKVITPTLGQHALNLAASITEPGIRRALGSDARPVLVDEFEAKDNLAKMRVESIMGLMRYSSSETDAMIVKGSNSGAGVEFFKIRSMFCTAAIGSLISDYADRTRISILGLKLMAGKAGADRFAEIEAMQRALLTEAWVDGLHARTMGMIEVIRKNADTFAIAGADVLGTRRLGDQLGTLLAGAYALTSREEISKEDAEAWLRKQDWTDEQDIIQDTDGPLCFSRIMEHQIMCEARQGGSVRRTIGELLEFISAKHGDEAVSFQIALDTCRRHGVLLKDGDMVAISNTHSAIKEILWDSPWAANWHQRLKTIRDATSSKATLSFGSGATSKAILVPRGSGS